MTKYKNSNSNKSSKTEIMTKLKNGKCDKTQRAIKLKN